MTSDSRASRWPSPESVAFCASPPSRTSHPQAKVPGLVPRPRPETSLPCSAGLFRVSATASMTLQVDIHFSRRTSLSFGVQPEMNKESRL